MARPSRQNAGTLSPGQAHYVLERLIKERRVAASEISRYIEEMGLEISDLEQRLQRLRDAAGPVAIAAVAGVAAGVTAAVATRRGRKPGRPPGSKNRPGRPPGRPPASATSSAGGASAGAQGGAKGGRKRRTAITPEQLASRQLQGRYLALVRRFPANKRAQYAKVAREKGREVAIREMKDASGRK